MSFAKSLYLTTTRPHRLAKMVFTTPSVEIPSLPFDPPDSIPIHAFQFEEEYSGCPVLKKQKDPFTCGLSGKTRSALEIKTRIEQLAQGITQKS